MVSFEVWDILTMTFNSKVISDIRTVVVIYTRYRHFVKKRFLDTYLEYIGMLNPKTNVDKLKKSIHICKVTC